MQCLAIRCWLGEEDKRVGDCRRFESCKSAGNLCSGCVASSDVRYVSRWGNALNEVILERVLPENLPYVTLDYRQNTDEFQALSSLMKGFNQYTWCSACREGVEKRCRDYLGKIFRDKFDRTPNCCWWIS